MKDCIKMAKDYYGVTDDWSKAGYLTPDGTLLDFSEGYDFRTLDHRNIEGIVANLLPENATRTDSLIYFMNLGNVRVLEGGLDVSCKLTKEQEYVIREHLQGRDSFYVDISDERGNEVETLCYDFTNVHHVVMDIQSHF